MENVCHSLAGMALARAGLVERTPLTTVALVVGANLPDVDLAWSSFRSALVYFHYHRGFTHSIAGFFLLTLLWWLALLLIERWLSHRGSTVPVGPLPLLLAASLGIGSHILMDAANSYGIRPFLPWNDRWVYGDLWVIVDPWLWLFLGGAVYLGGTGGKRRDTLWLMGAIAAAIVVLSASPVPWSRRAVWLAALLMVLAICLRIARRGRPGPEAARVGLALVVLYASLCALSHKVALARAVPGASQAPDGAGTIAILPLPADPFRWELILATDTSIRHRTVSALSTHGTTEATTVLPRGFDLPAAGELFETCAGRVVREFFRFPFATIESEPDGSRTLVVRDARYTRSGRGFAVFVAGLDSEGRPREDPRDCP